jgi:hypothetical protein
MNTYEVEIIFEPTGDYMNFTYEAEAEDETALLNEVLNQLSIVSWKVDE